MSEKGNIRITLNKRLCELSVLSFLVCVFSSDLRFLLASGILLVLSAAIGWTVPYVHYTGGVATAIKQMDEETELKVYYPLFAIWHILFGFGFIGMSIFLLSK